MTIRFTCAECASVLKIKDELAGTNAKCPKCKTKFVVPAAPLSETASPPAAARAASLSSEVPPPATHETEAVLSPSVDAPMPSYIPEPDAQVASLVSPLVASEEHDSPLPQPDLPNLDHSVATPGADAMQPLHLGDSDVGASELVESTKMDHPDSAPGSAYALALGGDDDDLDSPPVMVGSASSMPVISAAGDSTTRSADRTDSSAQLSHKAPQGSSKHRGDEPFDPLKYLMSDSTSQKHSQFPGNMQDDSDLSLSDDSDYDIGGRQTPQPISRPTPVPSGPRIATEKVDLATAAKMMKKAIKDSQADAAHQRHLEEKAGFDYGQFFREFGLRGLAILVGGTALVVLCVYLGRYMFTPVLLTPKLCYVSGTVKLDGQPFVGAQVYFEPRDAKIEGGKRDRPRTSIGITDEKGNFRMMYVPGDRIEGVAAGKCRVWVTRLGQKGEDVPNDWRQAQMKEFDVTPGNQKAPFEINMMSKAAGAK